MKHYDMTEEYRNYILALIEKFGIEEIYELFLELYPIYGRDVLDNILKNDPNIVQKESPVDIKITRNTHVKWETQSP